MPLEPGLYLVATPIGHLADITYRAVETLKSADLLLCEDTRHTAKLCAAYGVTTPRSPYHDHNADETRPAILAALQAGARIALVSDAGTPLISDPGCKLVREARAAGVNVVPLPGPSAVIAALSAAGAPTDRFLFAGFPPTGAGQRESFFKSLAGAASTLVFYEAPSRLAASLAAMATAFGDRPAVIARELTKIHEEFVSDTLEALAARYRDGDVRGEIVVIVHPPGQKAVDPDAVDRFLVQAVAQMSVKDAASAAADAFDMPRREAYERAMTLKASS